eukprot:4270973-Pyramimonas_sp.AAC.1
MSSPKPTHGGGNKHGVRSILSARYKHARSYLAKIKYGGVDPEDVLVGFLELTVETRRKSGAEAWSERINQQLVELPFLDFTTRFPSEDDIPFLQVKYFKENGEVVLALPDVRKVDEVVVGKPAITSTNNATHPHHPLNVSPRVMVIHTRVGR